MHSAKIAGKGLVLSAIAFSIAFLAENAGQLSEHLPESVHNWVTSLAVNYQRWSSGPRNLESRYAAIVALEQRSFPGMINESCGQRKIVTRLLPRLADAQASVIVIDLAFARDNCRPDSNQSITIQLQSSLNSVSDRIPVVIGQSSVDFSQVSEPERRALEAAGMLKDTLRLRPLFDSIPGSNTRIGLIRANKDVRRVPLEWPTFEPQSDGNVRYAGLRPSLSLQAARVVRNSFPGGLESIERFVTSGIHPYTTLMKPESFIRARASDLLCGTDVVQNACMPDTLRATREQLRGKVALVGWVDDSNDTHETPAGTMPGIFLQANYIESLLDGRLLHAVPLSWQFGLTLVWFVLIECKRTANPTPADQAAWSLASRS
jgi:CHASE2 domain-containing sensor protein